MKGKQAEIQVQSKGKQAEIQVRIPRDTRAMSIDVNFNLFFLIKIKIQMSNEPFDQRLDCRAREVACRKMQKPAARPGMFRCNYYVAVQVAVVALAEQ